MDALNAIMNFSEDEHNRSNLNQLLLMHTIFEGKMSRLNFAIERVDHAIDKQRGYDRETAAAPFKASSFIDRNTDVANKLLKSILYKFRRAEGYKLASVPASPGMVYENFAQAPEQWKEAYLQDLKDAIHSLLGVAPRVELKQGQ
ncbi:MAG: hypothetical protein SGARI_008290, partial [Bacillariaceae sp.]